MKESGLLHDDQICVAIYHLHQVMESIKQALPEDQLAAVEKSTIKFSSKFLNQGEASYAASGLAITTLLEHLVYMEAHPASI